MWKVLVLFTASADFNAESYSFFLRTWSVARYRLDRTAQRCTRVFVRIGPYDRNASCHPFSGGARCSSTITAPTASPACVEKNECFSARPFCWKISRDALAGSDMVIRPFQASIVCRVALETSKNTSPKVPARSGIWRGLSQLSS